jgi:predicted amidohydrolase YtcJ
MGSAYAEFQDQEKGTISPGKLADMVLVSDDLFSLPPEKIRDAKVLQTWVAGKVVFSQEK